MTLGGSCTFVKQLVHQPNGRERPAQLGDCAACRGHQWTAQRLHRGDRYGVLRDSFGHRWSMGQPVREVSREEITPYVSGQS